MKQRLRRFSTRFRSAWIGLLVAAVLTAGCATAPPKAPDNICLVFKENKSWWKAAKRAERRWDLEPSVGMAFVHRESAYVHDAKPPRGKLFGFVPWFRPSSAYGYAQATDEAWSDYLRSTDRWFADRDDFGDSLDFIGWYNHYTHRKLKISNSNARHLYLAYHEGWSGYSRGAWRRKPQVLRYADKVERRAIAYRQQLQGCRRSLNRGWWIF